GGAHLSGTPPTVLPLSGKDPSAPGEDGETAGKAGKRTSRSIGDRLLPSARRPEVPRAPAPQGTQKTAKEMGPRRVHRCIPVAAAHGILQQQPGNIELHQSRPGESRRH